GEIAIDNRGISIPAISTTQEMPLPEALLNDIAASNLASRANNSKRSYATAWRQFVAWCAQHNRNPLPASPETVQAWIVSLAKSSKITTIKNRIAAIASAHRVGGHAFDRKLMIGLVLDGVRRQNGSAKKQARAITLADVRSAANQLPESLSGLRDRALLLIGFFGAMRRSELVGLDFDTLGADATGYVKIVSAGLVVTLCKSKTDQYGEGQTIGLPRRRDELCPVRALEAWLAAAGIASGPIFRMISKGGIVGASRLTPLSVN